MSGQPERWRGRAFGLDLSGDFALPGLRRCREPSPGPHTRLRLVSPSRLEGSWPADEARRVSRDAEPGTTIDFHERSGYLFSVQGLGAFGLGKDGLDVRCAPAVDGDDAWRWQRYLVGQVLPFASLLRGFEVFHAGAVALAGSLVALMGDSGIGKSTLAANLHLMGLDVVTDDVLAVQRRGRGVVGHPGLATLKLRPVARSLVPDHARLGPPAFAGPDELRFPLDRPDSPLPLRVVYLLEPAAADRVSIVEHPAAEATPLLASTFNLVVDSPERLVNQLDVCAAIAHGCRLFTLRVPSRPGLEVGRTLHAHLRAVLEVRDSDQARSPAADRA
jgi:hypothetical protein